MGHPSGHLLPRCGEVALTTVIPAGRQVRARTLSLPERHYPKDATLQRNKIKNGRIECNKPAVAGELSDDQMIT